MLIMQKKKKTFFNRFTLLEFWIHVFLISLCFIQEWDDYRENKKDYSGLKIENLKIEEQISEDEEEETEINEVRVEKKWIWILYIREISENWLKYK